MYNQVVILEMLDRASEDILEQIAGEDKECREAIRDLLETRTKRVLLMAKTRVWEQMNDIDEIRSNTMGDMV